MHYLWTLILELFLSTLRFLRNCSLLFLLFSCEEHLVPWPWGALLFTAILTAQPLRARLCDFDPNGSQGCGVDPYCTENHCPESPSENKGPISLLESLNLRPIHSLGPWRPVILWPYDQVISVIVLLKVKHRSDNLSKSSHVFLFVCLFFETLQTYLFVYQKCGCIILMQSVVLFAP